MAALSRGLARARGLNALLVGPQCVASLVWLAGLTLSVLAGWWMQVHNDASREQAFQSLVDEQLDLVQERFSLYEHGLRGLAGAIHMAGEGALSPARFEAFFTAREIQREFPGARNFGFVRRVPRAREAEFVQRLRSAVGPKFRIQEMVPHDDDRFVVEHVSPRQGDEAILGLDVAAEPNRRAVALAAMRSGLPRLSAPIALVQAELQSRRGFVIMLPVYRGGPVPDTLPEREDALVGWTYARLVVEDVLRDLGHRGSELGLTLTDTVQATPFYRSPQLPSPDPVYRSRLTAQRDLILLGRTWQVQAQALPAFTDSLQLTRPLHVIAALATLATALALALHQALQSRARRRELSRDAQRFAAAIVEAMPHAVLVADAQGRIVHGNQQARQLFGRNADELASQSVDALVPLPMRATYDRLRRNQEPERAAVEHFSVPVRRYDGTDIHAAVTLAPLDFNGQAYVVAGVVDETPQRRAQAQLQELLAHLEQRVAERTAALERTQRDLHNILDALPSLVSCWDRNLVNRFANGAVRQWLGVEPDTEPRPHLRQVLGEALYEESLPHAEAVLRGEARTFERSFPRPDGPGWRHAVTHYLPDVVDGEVRGFYSVVHDVTEIVESRRALCQERERLQAILHDTHVGTWEWNVQTGETRFNERWAGIVGWTLDELSPLTIETWRRLAHPDDLGRSNALLTQHFSGATPVYECEARMRHRGGRWVWVRSVGRVATRTADGQPEWVHGIHQDITEHHATQQVLRDAMRAAESANAAKSEFLANMSHEIRTPLNAIVGLGYLLEQSWLDTTQRNAVAKIQLASRSLLGVVNDVLDLAKIEAREMELEQRTFSLDDVLQELRDLFAPQARAKGVAFEIASAPPSARSLSGDLTRLRQMLSNLLSNALKFTEKGHVALQVQAAPVEDAPRLRLRFEVEDTGIGVAPEALPRLFQPFVQADASTTRRFGGTGLGLSIVRRLARHMDGDAGASSEPGVGSVFWVEVQLERGGQETSGFTGPRVEVMASRQLEGVRVLVADDSDINRDVARRILALQGAVVSCCANGLEALESLRSHPHACDVVLMDVQMPVMDGLEATRRIRGELGLSALPILAFTAGALASERQRVRDAGMDDFVTKPLDPSVLVRIVGQHAGRQTTPAPRQAVGSTAASPWPQIDGIDSEAVASRLGGDVALFRSLMARLLRETEALQDADEAIAALRADPVGFASRLHRLRGTAGTLGASTVQGMASALEKVLRHTDVAWSQAEAGTLQLATVLREMRSASSAFLAQGEDVTPEVSPAQEDGGAGLQELMALLARRDLGAIDAFRGIEAWLQESLGRDLCAQVREAIECLRFSEAAKLLDPPRATSGL